MARKRIVLELDETAKPGPRDPMSYMPTVGPNTSIELNGGVWNFVAFEDIPPEGEKVTIVRDDLRALAALQDVADLVNQRCDELHLDRNADAICGKPAPEPLKPCPFCGVLPVIYQTEDGCETWVVECRNKKCNCNFVGDSEEEIRAAWNRRVTP